MCTILDQLMYGYPDVQFRICDEADSLMCRIIHSSVSKPLTTFVWEILAHAEIAPMTLWTPIQLSASFDPFAKFQSQHTHFRPTEDKNEVETWNLKLRDTHKDNSLVFIWRIRQSTKDYHGLSIKDAEFLSFFDQNFINLPISLSTYRPFKASTASNSLSFV